MLDFRMVEVEEAPYLFNERTCSMDPADISGNMGIASGTVGTLVGRDSVSSEDELETDVYVTVAAA